MMASHSASPKYFFKVSFEQIRLSTINSKFLRNAHMFLILLMQMMTSSSCDLYSKSLDIFGRLREIIRLQTGIRVGRRHSQFKRVRLGPRFLGREMDSVSVSGRRLLPGVKS